MSSGSQLQHFILVFDHGIGSARPVESFGSAVQRAMKRYEQLESEFRDNSEIDIVLVASDSIETVRVTHANYFDGTAATAKLDRLIANYLGGLERSVAGA